MLYLKIFAIFFKFLYHHQRDQELSLFTLPVSIKLNNLPFDINHLHAGCIIENILYVLVNLGYRL